LPNVVATASALADSGPVGPPPGLSTATGSAGEPSRPRQPPTPAQSNGEALADSTSTESEAGPSTASPAPRTPARLNDLPPPLTSEPIILHSPYEEPRIAYFPASDPGFAFVLDIDDSELARHQAAAGGYQPSPFSKTLLGLAELGVLAPEIPQLSSQPPGLHGFSGSFQPFDTTLDADQMNDGDGDAASDDREEEDLDGPRTTSRFEFARQGSMSRGQSPFAVRRSGEDPTGARSGWIGAMPGQAGQILGDGSGMSAAQLGSFVGSYDSPTNEPSWPAESSYGASPSFSRHMQMQGQGQGQSQGQGQGQGQGHMRDEREGKMFGFSGKGRVVDQDDFDPSEWLSLLLVADLDLRSSRRNEMSGICWY
jgi:CCR4-NOT transcription complex subunit 4